MKDYSKKNEVTPETAEHIQDLARTDYAVEFPIDLNLDSMIHISLPEIKWKNFDSIPSSMKISNTGKSVILTTHWANRRRPSISGGPLLGNYAFSQLHFLWGRKDFRGGKHTYNRKTFPLEIHALFYKCEYGTRTEALRHKDGAIVLVFASKVGNSGDPAMNEVCSRLSALSSGAAGAAGAATLPSHSVQVHPPIKMADLIHKFAVDYFLYWGTITTSSCNHLLLWLVCRKPFLISQSQVHHFRRLMTAKQNHIINNSQSTARIHPNFKRVFHINPSKYFADVLYEVETTVTPLPRKEFNKTRTSDSLRPSTTGLRSSRSDQASGFRPVTATGTRVAANQRLKESLTSQSDKGSIEGRRKKVNKDKELKKVTGSDSKSDKSRTIRSKSCSNKNLKSSVPTFGICVSSSKNDIFEEKRRGLERKRVGDNCVERDIDTQIPRENKVNSLKVDKKEFKEKPVFGSDSSYAKLEDSGIQEYEEDEPVEQIFINNAGVGLKEFPKMETIYSEGSEHSAPQNNNRIDSCYPSRFFGSTSENNAYDSNSVYTRNEFGSEYIDDECFEFSDDCSLKNDRERKPRSCFTYSSPKIDSGKLASIKDSLEMIRQNFVRSETTVDGANKKKSTGEEKQDGSKTKVVDRLEKALEAAESCMGAAKSLSKKQQFENSSKIKSRSKEITENTSQQKANLQRPATSPPRWRY